VIAESKTGHTITNKFEAMERNHLNQNLQSKKYVRKKMFHDPPWEKEETIRWTSLKTRVSLHFMNDTWFLKTCFAEISAICAADFGSGAITYRYRHLRRLTKSTECLRTKYNEWITLPLLKPANSRKLANLAAKKIMAPISQMIGKINERSRRQWRERKKNGGNRKVGTWK